MEDQTLVTIGAQSLRIAWLFQGIAAFPTASTLLWLVFGELYSPYLSIYRFITYTFNGLFAAGIIFIVLLQYNLHRRSRRLGHEVSNSNLEFIFETAKSVLATALWVWYLLDSIFYKLPYYYGGRGKRIAMSAISVLLLLALFYSTAVYAAYAKKAADHVDLETQVERNIPAEETTPLLADVRNA